VGFVVFFCGVLEILGFGVFLGSVRLLGFESIGFRLDIYEMSVIIISLLAKEKVEAREKAKTGKKVEIRKKVEAGKKTKAREKTETGEETGAGKKTRAEKEIRTE
jgi:hypothetical protein